jgi:hypothetical protein
MEGSFLIISAEMRFETSRNTPHALFRDRFYLGVSARATSSIELWWAPVCYLDQTYQRSASASLSLRLSFTAYPEMYLKLAIVHQGCG